MEEEEEEGCLVRGNRTNCVDEIVAFDGVLQLDGATVAGRGCGGHS